jgi:hypothetical protein
MIKNSLQLLGNFQRSAAKAKDSSKPAHYKKIVTITADDAELSASISISR